ncbi:unnamed protein product [Phytomonas sp. EM1]|nr:unnamed protein product [Phytomonas sp. EM1]|eukprot:CCW61353.1 unnamed protein product [Phytomonas sp. isolate EM1]
MSNQGGVPHYSLDPFTYVVTRRDVEEGSATLMRIAFEDIRVPLADLRAVNSNLKDVPADEILPVGTVVRLPVMLDQRGDASGPFFILRDAERQLKACEDRMFCLASEWERDVGPLPQPVVRKVLSKNEQVLQVVESEVERQLPKIQKAYETLGNKDQLLQYLVDVERVKAKEVEVEKEFSASNIPLASYDPKYALLWSSSQRLVSEDNITDHSIQTKADTDEDFCMEHTHRWEFMILAPGSMEEWEAWAVLSCQKLTALLDAITCTPRLPFSLSKNAFLFIGETFYIDDRHRNEPGFEDLSAVIRGCVPSAPPHGEPPAPCRGANAAFQRCPVRSAAEVTFGELRVKQGETCVLRHAGCCTHYFYLQGPRCLRGCPRTQREQFPHRTRRRRDRVLRCQMCHQFPSSIALYGDELSMENPALYCTICYEYLHGGESEAESRNYLKVMPQNVGDYFTC